MKRQRAKGRKGKREKGYHWIIGPGIRPWCELTGNRVETVLHPYKSNQYRVGMLLHLDRNGASYGVVDILVDVPLVPPSVKWGDLSPLIALYLALL